MPPSRCAAEKPAQKTVPKGTPLPAGSWKTPSHAVIFILLNDDNTQTLVPKTTYLWNGEAKPKEIWWIYFHESATVTFKEPLMPPVPCTPSGFGTGGICKVTIPKAAKGVYPYGVTGVNKGKPVTPVDPEVEIDR